MRRNLVVSALPVSLAALLLVLVSAVGAAAGSTAPAVASGTASVSGEVMGFSYYYDDPLPGVRVSVLNASSGAVMGSAMTDAYGQFRVYGLPAGPVKVRGTKTGWLTTFYNGKFTLATADTYTLATGQALDLGVLDIDAEAVVEGQVLGWMDPLAGAAVTVLDAVTGKSLKTVTADVSGNYRIGGLHAGTIKVRASKTGYLTGYADGGTTFASGATYTLEAGQTLSQQWSPGLFLYLDLTPEAVVQGQVLSWMDPLGGATVTVLDAVTGKAIRSVTADVEGNYRIGGLHAGTVKVRATKVNWIPGFANSKPSLATADVFALEANQTLTLSWDALDLQPEAVIAGTVHAAGRYGAPLAGAKVVVYDAATGRALRSALTGVDGTYRMGQLTSYAPIKVRASAPGFVTQYYRAAQTIEGAVVITPGPTYGSTATVIDFVLERLPV